MEKVAEAKAVATADQAESVIRALIKERVEGVSDREAEAIELGNEFGIDESWIRQRFADAGAEAAAKARTKFLGRATKPDPAPLFSAGVQPPIDNGVDAQSGPEPKKLHDLIVKLPVQLDEAEAGPKNEVALRGALGFQHSKSPNGIAASLENTITALERLDLDCRYDVFHDKIIVKGREITVSGDVVANLDNITLKVRQTVLAKFGFDPGKANAFDALMLRCLDHISDPVRDYLDGLRWDERERLDSWLVSYCGAEDNELNRAIGRKMLIALCAGCDRRGVSLTT